MDELIAYWNALGDKSITIERVNVSDALESFLQSHTGIYAWWIPKVEH